MSHYVYVVRCADDTFYTGYTVNLEKRLAEHNGEGTSITAKSSGARYTRGRRPVKLLYSEEFTTRSEALRRECDIKKLSRVEKMKLVQSNKVNYL
jgi:putative endonuclease